MAEVSNVFEPGAIKETTFEDTRDLRYAEVFFVGPEWIIVYNSIGLSEAPPAQWDAFDAGEIAKQFGAGTVVLNGPHWWESDTMTMQWGVNELTINDIGFRYAARLPAFLAASGKLEPPFYTVVEANKTGDLGYSAGKPVYELVSPDGEIFVMQSSNVEPSTFATLGQDLSLAEGWQFHTRTLDEDMSVLLDGKVRVVMDDFHNVYNHAPDA